MNRTEIELTNNITVELPMLPNFLQVKIGKNSKSTVSIADLTDDNLKKVADAWKKELLAHAKRKRNNKN